MGNLTISFILGLSGMFYGMTSWLFFRKGRRLSVIVASLMALLGIQCFISVWFILKGIYLDEYYWAVMTSIDVVAVPFYALVLRELVRPSSVTSKTGVANIMPFVVASALFLFTGWIEIYWLLIGSVSVYGIVYFIWTHVNIGKYNRKIREQYSFTENINLNWLRMILWFFLGLLSIWIVDTLAIHTDIECFYLMSSIVMWMVIDFFIYKHETVMGSLNSTKLEVMTNGEEDVPLSKLGSRIELLFSQEQIYLNPNLKISDVAAAVGSNRTYVSNYFNKNASSTFYDYVNALRIEHACRLLKDSDDSVKVIADKSGYNSSQTFIRVFTKIKGVSPTEYRRSANR